MSSGGQIYTRTHGESASSSKRDYNLKEKQETHTAPRCSAFEAGGGINEMQQQFVSVSHD